MHEYHCLKFDMIYNILKIYYYFNPIIFNYNSNDCSYPRHDIILTFSWIFLLVTLKMTKKIITYQVH